MRIVTAALILSMSAFVGCGRGCGAPPQETEEAEEVDAAPAKPLYAEDVKERLAQFAPTPIDFDEALVSAENKVVLRKLVQAAQIVDGLFLKQVSEDNPKVRADLVAAGAPEEVLTYFDVMYGPWDRVKGDEPFVTGIEAKPPGASFYPADLTKEELEGWIEKHPDQAEAFRGYFTVIRRKGADLVAIPYSEYYAEDLKTASGLLKEAAAAAKHPALGRYLEARAAAFSSNDYRESDMAWMDLGDSPIEVVIGPYEVYEDRLMGYKAAFEAFITLRDPEYSEKLEAIGALNAELEKDLPIEKEHLTKRGLESPISVAVEVFTAGDTRAGVQTLAFNLPNDEVVREKKGSKKVMLKNVIEAKFNQVLIPIAKKLVDPALLEHVRFDPYFTQILIHELAHGMGPGKIEVDGRRTDVNKELKELYPGIEECKADIVGLVNGAYMIEKGHLPKEMKTQLPATYVAGVFRSIRFGTEEAHAKAVLLSFNYLREQGAVTYDEETERFGVNYETFDAKVRDLARELMLLQAKGSYDAAKAMLEKYGHATPEIKKALAKLGDVPVDIRPEYTIVEKMESW